VARTRNHRPFEALRRRAKAQSAEAQAGARVMAAEHGRASNRIIGDHIVECRLRAGVSVPAQILMLPIARRPAFAARIAQIAQAIKRKRSDDTAEHYLAAELRRYRHELAAREIPPAIISRELHAMEPAIRGELWRLMFGPLSGTGRRK
jgi:hypothetical protein